MVDVLGSRRDDAAPVPDRELGRRWSGLRGPSGVLAAASGVVAYVGWVSPYEPGNYPTCPILALTGVHCPGCGSLRALHEVVHGDIAAAIGLNLLAVAVAPLLAYWWLRWVRRSWSGAVRPPLAHPLAGWLLLASIVIFAIARNLPIGAALAP